jgi:rubrerythrin
MSPTATFLAPLLKEYMPIATPEDLRDHIDLAVRIELSTIPPYLYALYSIVDQASEAALLLRSIVAEEMLHAALAANLLLAVGGRPRFAGELMPTYPALVPYHQPPLELNLEPCSTRLIQNVFLRIEQPEAHHRPSVPGAFGSLGQFYHAVENGIESLAEVYDLFANPQVDSQFADPAYYVPVVFDAEDSGGLLAIVDVASARQAIEVIVHQGEGLSTRRWADAAHQELTHYYKLLQIIDGASPLGAVRRLRRNPRTADFPDELQPVSDLFNACYHYLFVVLDELFGPGTDNRDGVRRLYLLMGEVLGGLARYLVEQPIGDGTFTSPTFEIYPLDRLVPGETLAALAATVRDLHPKLGGALSAIHEARRSTR